MPRVTMAMPIYNGENFVAEAIESILAQDFVDFELVITDNASQDGTERICQSYAERDERVHYHRNPKNLGAAPNYNRGFELARGQYLKWCAHDDRISPNYLTECVAILDARPEVALAFGRVESIDADGAPIALVGGAMPDLSGLAPVERFERALRYAGTCFEIFGLFRMDVLRRTSLHRLYYGSDRALLAETALLGEYACAQQAVFYNREHGRRSIHIDDKRERVKWQFAEGGARSFEHWALLAHLLQIASAHPDWSTRGSALARVSRYALTRRQLARYVLELIGAASPELQRWLRRKALSLPSTA